MSLGSSKSIQGQGVYAVAPLRSERKEIKQQLRKRELVATLAELSNG